jgi:hypothetical protein
MGKPIVVLLGLNAEHEVVKSDNGIAFSTGELMHQQWVAIYVATSDADAEAAIAYYADEGTLKGFIDGGNHE